MGLPILVRRHLYIETPPRWHVLERVKITSIEKGVQVYLVELKYNLRRGKQENKKSIVDIDIIKICVFDIAPRQDIMMLLVSRT